MKFYLDVPYGQHKYAKAMGASWEPSSKRWYCVSESVLNRCRQWALPLTAEQKAYLDSPARTAAYARAMEAYNAQTKTFSRPEQRINRSSSRGGSR